VHSKSSQNFVLFLASIVFLAPATPARTQFSDPAVTPLSATTIPQSDQIQPAELARTLKAGGAEQPVIFQVGSFVMFQQAHIPNARFAGPASQATGLTLLKKLSAPLSRKQLIVIYCGCCPWSRCPNMGTAYKALRDLGFKNVKALYLASNFGDDWVAKGFPAEKGE
jgi:thiosulfate/3-mercaptopyruvate sulfurtransferase